MYAAPSSPGVHPLFECYRGPGARQKVRARDPRQLRRPQASEGLPMAPPTPPLLLPLHADLMLVAQRRRGLLRQTRQAAVEARCIPIRCRTSGRYQPLRRRHQRQSKTLFLDRRPRQNYRCCQAGAPSVRFHPLAVREGVTVDLSTVESTRKALLAARSLTLSDSSTGGLSGPNALKVLANLGIAEQVRDRLKPTANGQDLIASGEIDIGLYNVSEIPRAKGVVLAGAVPAAVQVYIVYDAAVPATNATPEPALELVRYLSRNATRPVWIKGGLEPAGE